MCLGVAGSVKHIAALTWQPPAGRRGVGAHQFLLDRAAVVTIDNSGSEKFARPGAAIMTAVTPPAEALYTRSILDARSAPTDDHDGR